MNNNGERIIKIEIPGNPVAKGAHRTTKSGISYTPEKTRKWEQIARLTASEQMKGQDPMSGAIIFMLEAYFDIPKSWPKWKKEFAKNYSVVHITKPDSSNLLKSAEDALNGVVFYDDSQIFHPTVYKRYSTKPRVEIIVLECAIVHSKTKRCEIEED